MTKNELNITHITNKDFDSLLKVNERYIYFICFKLNQNEEHLDDLIQSGRIGLYNAYSTYNQDINPIFMAYAKHHIIKEIHNYIDNQLDTIRISLSAKYKNKVKIKTSYKTISTSTKIYGDDDNLTLGETLSSENDTEIPDERISVLNRIIEGLNEKEKQLIKEYYFEKKTLQQIGDERNKTRQAISLQLKKIENKIKLRMQNK